MARPKHSTFKISVRADITDIQKAIIPSDKVTTTSGSWPGRPYPADRVADSVLADLKAVHEIPSITNGNQNPMTILEHALVHGRDAIAAERRAPDRKMRKIQIEKIAASSVGDPMPFDLQEDVYRLLTGAAVMDLRLGARDWSRFREIGNHVCGQTVVTVLMREWATWLIMFGSTNLRSHRRHGGGSLQAELVFVSVLLSFWTGDLGRPLKTWVSARDPHSAAPLTNFVRDCLEAVGAGARTAAVRKKISHVAPMQAPLSRRRLKLEDAHQRILRVKKEFRAAEAAGLRRNYLSRQLNAQASPA
jgi:hypothetical protein